MVKIKLIITVLGVFLLYNAVAQSGGNVPGQLPDFDYTKPVFKLVSEQLENKNRHLRYSVLTGYREGIEPIVGQLNTNFKATMDKEKGTHQLVMYNLSIEQMLTHGLLKPTFVILEVKDPSRYRYNPSFGPKLEWMRKNAYCYELLLPLGTIKGIKIVEDDLARRFKLKRFWEKRMVKSLVLIRTSTLVKFETKGGEETADVINGRYRNVTLANIGGPIYQNNILPFLDETGYTGKADLDLNVSVKSMADIPALRKALQKYDLDLIEADRMVDMLIIKEIN